MTTPLLIRGKNALKLGNSLRLSTIPNWVSPTKHFKSVEDMIETLRHSVQLWERLHVLYILGGALNLSKCFWSLQYWEWER